jgi:hypothetical protein
MKKLNLSLDTLQVESFAIDVTHPQAGTVRGHISIACPASAAGTCYDWDSACGGGASSACTSPEELTCGYPTYAGLTCDYETCGACNPSDENCTTYCP